MCKNEFRKISAHRFHFTFYRNIPCILILLPCIRIFPVKILFSYILIVYEK
jgi:hypothetical protein